MTRPIRVNLTCALAFLALGCEDLEDPPGVEDVVLTEQASVGVVEGDELQEFGMVMDVRALPDSSFLVLDPIAPAVGWFSADGDYLGGIRGRGEGPGELAQPHALEVVSPGRLVVADRRNGRLNRFRFDADGFVPDGIVPGDWFGFPSGRTICSVSGRRFVHRVREGHLLHEVGDDWQPVRSFGPVAPIPREELAVFEDVVLRVLNRGRLECLDSPPMLLWISENLPYVRAFTVEGEQVWEHGFADLRPRDVVLQPGVGLEVDPVEGSHEGLSLVRWSEDALLVQYRFWPPEGGVEDGDPLIIDSRVLSLSTGEELGRTDTLPRIMATRGGLVYSLDDSLYARVVVWSRDR